MKFFIISYVNSLKRMKYIIHCLLILLYSLKNSMLTCTIFIYSVTYKVNLFGKAFAHVRNCLRKEKHMYGTNKNIDGFYTKTTQIWGFRVKIKKKSVIPTYSIFQHVYGKHNLVSFYGRIVFWQENCIVVFYIILFFVRRKR